MTTTRRKAKATAEHDGDPTSDANATLTVSIPEDLDEEVLTNLLPETKLTSISSEDVVALFRLLITQAINLDAVERERDEVKGELERREVELDQLLQDRESSAKDLEESVDAAHQELNHVKQERDQLAHDKAALQAQLSSLSSTQSNTSAEFENTKRRVDDVEREKRDLVTVISRLKDEATQRDEEIHTLRANLKEARQEHQLLEGQVRELRSTETATKFKLDTLSQQLQLSQGEAERANTELNNKTEEFSKYRRTKHAETANLQASFDSLTQSYASTEASFKALQSAHTAQTHQLTQALSKVQNLQSQLAEQEARYSSEINGLKRLVNMMEDREKQAKEIVENVEREWATVGEKAERRESALRDEAERERKGREEAEKRLDQLETVLDRMGRGELPVPARSTPSTPFRGGDLTMDGMMGLSPTVAMASKAQRTGKTFTEVYADYIRLQEEYAKKSAEYDHMDRTLSSVLAQIEERAPILSQQRIEYERLQVEASQLGSQLAQALSERDSQSKLAHEQTQKLAKFTTENNLLQRQLEDLGRQVQILLREVGRRDDPTIPSDDELEDMPAEPITDTDAMITNHLVLFRNIEGVQNQNMRLLKIVRELGDKMENEEREYREAMEKEQGEAIREAHEAMQDLATQLERQKKSSESVIQAYVKERDSLKAMIARLEKGSSLASNGATDGAVISSGSSDLAKELAEVQGQFGAYKLEMGLDSDRVRDDLIAAQREINTVSAALAKANAKVEFLTDRHRMNEEQFRVHNLEIDELSKRNTILHEQNVRLDIECGRVTDELQVAAGRLEQLRNECANLRAEKKIWEHPNHALWMRTRTLAMERSHLSDLMTNVQKMHNDLERSGENDRRRLEGQLQMLEGQTQDLRKQLLQERDAVRHISLQKELELKELQTRLDKNIQEMSKTREALVEAQTSKRHLEEKVEDISRQLKGNEEKLSVYERRSTNSSSQPAELEAHRELSLETEVAELRATLKVTEVDLASAKAHRDQFQEISQASETALAALNATFDEYKVSSESHLARHESEVKALQERLETTAKELADVRSQFNDAQKSFESERTAWINDKKTLEDTIVDMSTSEKHSESDRNSREHEIKALEDRAKTAESRYSQEIIAHAETVRANEAIKKELSVALAAAREHATAAETAQAKLVSSEGSWKQQREALDKEVTDLNTRCKELAEQNATLHQHLESVSAQASRIRQAAEAPSHTDVDNEAPNADVDTRLTEMRSVVSYLRKEKEIVDLQLEMSKRENSVQKNQIERLSQTLQETRATLAEERERAIENTASAAQHAELVERINQLNILRESNSTLRAECESSARKTRELETKLTQLATELDPAKEAAAAAKAELEATKVQMQRLEQESKRWQERNVQLLTKYDRIDPAEMQALKDEIAKYKGESSGVGEKLKEKEAEAASLQGRIELLESNLRSHRETANRNNQGFKQKLGELNGQKSALTEEKKQLEARVAALEAEKATLQASQVMKPDTSAPSAAQAEEVQKHAALVANLRAELDKLLAEKETWTRAALSDGTVPAHTDWEAEKAQLMKERDEALETVKTANAAASKAVNDSKHIKFQNDKFQAKITDLMKTKAADAEKQQTAIAEAVEKAKAEQGASASDSSASEELVKRHADELKALEQKIKAQHQAELQAKINAAVEEALRSRPPPAANPDQQAAIDAAVAATKAEAEKRQADEIAQAVERGRMEQGAKMKLKDSQLIRAQKRVKDLEAQIQGLQATGSLPSTSSSTAAPAPAATSNPGSASTAPKPQATRPPAAGATAGPSHAKTAPPAAATGQAASTNLPKKPGVPTGPGAAAAGTPTAIRGAAAGRGAVRGRGVPLGRGGAALRQPPVKPTAPTTPTSGGVSIMGAAGKRPREETAGTVDDSLAKRLKPAPAESTS